MKWIMMLVFLLMGGPVMAYEEAAYDVIKADGDYEIRRYTPALMAEVALPEKGADNTAFRALFDYIQGANVGSQKVAMTVPVTTAAEGQKIAMTVPVTMAPEGSAGTVMRFFLPRTLTLATAPKPTDTRVVIKEIPAEEVAVVRFSGFGWDSRMANKEADLRTWLKNQGMPNNGVARWVFYNAPFTLPWMRRNEVWVSQ
jgi:hypothetical protein